jgi:hypothetical protein
VSSITFMVMTWQRGRGQQQKPAKSRPTYGGMDGAAARG